MNDPFGGNFSFIKEVVRAKEPWLALLGGKVVLGFCDREILGNVVAVTYHLLPTKFFFREL